MNQSSYQTRGVSAEKGDVHAAVRHQAPGLFPGAFCKLVADFLSGSPEHALTMHADGAGTKSLLAYLYWKETGDASVFRGIAQDATVMNTDDLLCVGAVDHFLLANTIGRNAHRIPGEILQEIIQGYQDMAVMLASHGITLHLVGGETADMGDVIETLIVDATVVARVNKKRVIDCANIRAGDAIIGIASSGTCAWETRANSGIGSNGLTCARHELLRHDYAMQYPEAFSDTIEPSQVYTGPYRLTDPLPGGTLTVGEALLSPTRTYLPFGKILLQECFDALHGIIHCTGGGQTKCRTFSGPGLLFVKDCLFDPPPIFRIIREQGNISDKEMYQVFNMGHRLEIYCREAAMEEITAIAGDFRLEAKQIGHVRRHPDNRENNAVEIHAGGDVFRYD